MGSLPVKYLLDTHAWIWALEAPEKLPDPIRAMLLEPDHLPFGLAAISPWEVAKKASKGLLQLSMPVRQWVAHATQAPFIELLPLSVDIALESAHLPAPFHKDPADQMIVATARMHSLVLISADQRLRDYPHVQTKWK
ncbi:MAG: type II toxin-antitoxin system VapC family toxin [Gemmatimonadetes bacterium]|nr:type II toxin-antitoxin system VapC family toxin [Gemmatimonadota bacterium]MYC69667.1 type II toxin-antitoxin system VapC family toxin [Gemmatimonadota bacterium]MYI60555.1 type II toxin-antitoxin system VapC family toxin [Gemmatimonadota bacterium]